SQLPGRLLWTCRRLHIGLTRFVLMVSVPKQEARLFERHDFDRRIGRSERAAWEASARYWLRRCCLVSTSRFGTGQQSGSFQTPLGLHQIAEKIGAGQPIGTVFKSRQPVGFTWQGQGDAAIAHRILWLDGLEPGFNRGGSVDS